MESPGKDPHFSDAIKHDLANRNIEESEKQLANIFKKAPVGIVIYSGADFIIELVNNQVLEMWGKALEEVQGKAMKDVFPEIESNKQIKAQHQFLVDKFLRGESVAVNEEKISFIRNGEPYTGWYNYTHEPIFDAHGKPAKVLAVAVEVTQQVLARNKIEETNRELEFAATISQSIADAVIGTTSYRDNYIITTWNKGAEAIYGWKAEEVIGKSARDILPTLFLNNTDNKEWMRTMDEKGSWTGEVIHKRKDGKPINILASTATVKNKEGKILGAVAVNKDISERKAALEKIKESEARFRFLFESNVFGIAFWSVSGEIYDANDAFFDTLKYTRQDMLQGKISWRTFTLPEDALLHQQKVEEAMKGKTVSPYEAICIDKLGNRIYVLVGYAKLTNSNEKGIAFMHDITKAKEAEAALRVTKEQFEATFKSIPSGIYQFSNLGNIEYINERGAELLGYDSVKQVMAQSSMQEFIQHIRDTFIILDEKGNKRPDEKGSVYIALTTGKTAEVVSQFINKKNEKAVWILSISTPVYDENGKLSFIITTATDITETKNAESSLRESESRFRTLAETLPQMIWVRNSNGIIEYGSKSWEEYSGIKDISEAWKNMVHPNDWDGVMNAWENNTAKGTSFRYEVRLKNAMSEYRWHYASGEPVKDEAGKIIKWIGSLTDIHVQKTFSENLEREVAKRTAELELSNEQLMQANKELESFNYIASHDLQEPLRKIQTFILLIEKNKEQDELFDKYFGKIRYAAQRMSDLIQSILDYSRLSKISDEDVQVDLQQVLNDVKNDLELIIKEKNAVIESDDLPVMTANSLQMHQVFTNLISNSLKFSVNKPFIKISCSIVKGDAIPTALNANRKQKFLYLSFKDNGIGFDPRFKEQIFQLFQRLHSKDEYSGTGIGLSIVKKIIDEHDGFITAESSAGEGATFHVWLPIKE